MTKYLFMSTMIVIQIVICCQAEIVVAESKGEQIAVEHGLRLPVVFENDSVPTFSVEDRLAFYQVPGLSFALIDNGKVVWTNGYGRLSSSSERPVTSSTVFQAASLAKPVTAFALMRMHDQGEIDINKPITEYLKSFQLPVEQADADKVISFENLLNHSSGLSAGGYMGYMQGATIPTDQQTLLGQNPANTKAVAVEFAAGKQVMYSGAGYTLAEVALQDEFGKPFEQLMDTWVLQPLDMHHSSFDMLYPHQTKNEVALGHDSVGAIIDGGWRRHPEQAAAGLWSTAENLAKLAIELTKGYHGKSDVISKRSVRQMLAPVKPEEDLSAYFGGQPAMTFVTDGAEKRFLFKHNGGNVGYRSFMLMYPETGDGAVFLTNSDAGFSVGFEMIRAVSYVYDWPDYKAKTYRRRMVDPIKQHRLEGDYEFENGLQVSLLKSKLADGIAIKFPNGDIYPLSAVEGKHQYVHQDSGLEVSFTDIDGQLSVFLYNQTALKK